MKTLTEKEAEDFLEKQEFDVVKRVLIKTKEELKNIEKKLNYPWVMKISSKHIVHKAKIGGTILNINSIKEAEIAFDKLKGLNNFEGILVQEMLSGEELILGIKSTPEFPHVIMFGKGGSNVEQDKDISFRVCPLEEKDADELIREPKIFKTIQHKHENIKKLKKIILQLSTLAEKYNISELDINPLILNKEEAVVVDSRIVMS